MDREPVGLQLLHQGADNGAVADDVGFMAQALRTALQAVAAGTLLEGAAIELLGVPGRLRCRYCEMAFAAPELYTARPGCGHDGARIIGGDDARRPRVGWC